MPPRKTPTARQKRLGVELRRLRDRAGLSVREAGELLSIDPARISSIEAGRFGVSANRVRTFALNYGCTSDALVDALAAMAGERERGWWEEYRSVLPASLLDLAEMEHHAVALRSVQVTHLPGLLQTADHARLLFGQVLPALPQHEVEFRVSHRLKRQVVLYREQPVPFTAVIHEAALRMQVGDKRVRVAQLRHILEMSQRENVTVLVVPFDAGVIPGAGQTVVLAEGPVPQLDTVQLDTEYGSVLVHAEGALERYRASLSRMEAMALGPDESRSFIETVMPTG